MIGGTSISSESQLEEFPNQSTPKASMCESPNHGNGVHNNTNNENNNDSSTKNPDETHQTSQKRERSIEMARETNFANMSILNTDNFAQPKEMYDEKEGEKKAFQEVATAAAANEDRPAVHMNLADEYFEAKQNKLERAATEIVITMDNQGIF